MSRAEFLFDLFRPVLLDTSSAWSEADVRRMTSGLAEAMPCRALPAQGETAAVALLKPKSAALCFDRVWAGIFGDVPDHLKFFGDTEVERRLFALWVLKLYAADRSQAYAHYFTDEHVDALGAAFLKHLGSVDNDALRQVLLTGEVEPVSRVYATAITARYGIPIVPIYSTLARRDAEYKPGDRLAVVTMLSDLEVVDEERLDWKQVQDFRADKESRHNYVRFLHWLDAEMVGKPITFVEDEINIRLHDYERAIRKHGIHTVLGTCSAILDPRTLVPAAGLYGTLATFSHDFLGAIAAGGVVLARGALHLAQTLLDLDEARRSGPEVAFVYQVSRKK